jgi:hypothetical protein
VVYGKDSRSSTPGTLRERSASICAEPRAVSLGDLDCFDLPRSGFRTKDAGEAREPVQSGRAPPGWPPNSQGRNDSLTISSC